MIDVMSPAEAARFWQRAVRVESGCWLWAGYRDLDGYGILTLNRKHWRAHRAAWTLTHGQIPAGMLILHSCDTPACIPTRTSPAWHTSRQRKRPHSESANPTVSGRTPPASWANRTRSTTRLTGPQQRAGEQLRPVCRDRLSVCRAVR